MPPPTYHKSLHLSASIAAIPALVSATSLGPFATRQPRQHARQSSSLAHPLSPSSTYSSPSPVLLPSRPSAPRSAVETSRCHSPRSFQKRFLASESQKDGNGLIGATRALATTDWLERNLGLVVPVDASFHLPTSGRSAEDEYKRCHIKNARFFDIEKIRDTQSPYPHMLPSADEFAKYMAELGVSDEDHVVVYDSVGMFSSPRVWWMLKVFGHDKVSVLDGGLPKWVNEGRPVMDKEVKISPKFYKAHKPNTRLFVNYNAVVSHLSNLENTTQIIDARPPARFNGQALEPRIGLPSGHMPGSINVPGSDLLDPATNTLLPKEKLAELFKAKGVDLEKPIVTTCGSGVTACALLFALDRIGAKNVSVYDGSWSEFAARADQDGIKIFQRGPVRSSADQ